MTDADPITRLNAALEGRYLADDIKHERRVALKVLSLARLGVPPNS